MLTIPSSLSAAARTPIGAFQGDFKDLTAPQLGAAAIRAAVDRAIVGEFPPGILRSVDEVLFGCVLPAGLGQAPARQAALGAGLPASTGAVTINKMCGSGMKAVMLAHDLLLAGSAKIVVAGGMESMSNAPYLLDRARSGYRMGHGRVLDHMFLDGLEDAYDKGRLMGTFAEDCAQSYSFTRDEQDEYALASLTRAQKATADGSFSAEIVPVTVTASRQDRANRHPRRAPAQSHARKNSSPQAGLSRRRNRHRRQTPAPSPTVPPPWSSCAVLKPTAAASSRWPP